MKYIDERKVVFACKDFHKYTLEDICLDKGWKELTEEEQDEIGVWDEEYEIYEPEETILLEGDKKWEEYTEEEQDDMVREFIETFFKNSYSYIKWIEKPYGFYLFDIETNIPKGEFWVEETHRPSWMEDEETWMEGEEEQV